MISGKDENLKFRIFPLDTAVAYGTRLDYTALMLTLVTVCDKLKFENYLIFGACCLYGQVWLN